MTTSAVAAAVEQVARAMHDLALALAAAAIGTGAEVGKGSSEPLPPVNARRCDCGGAVVYREWTSKAGKACRAHKCENSRIGEQHYLEWAS